MNRFNFDKIIARLERQKDGLGLKLANVAKNEFLGNFKEQGFNGKKWQDVKRRTNPTKKDIRTGASTRAILQGKGSGRLRKDVANSVASGHKISNTGYTLKVDNPYAGYLNEGTEKMPKRQFVGTTPRLNNKLLNKVNQEIKIIWRD
jgi:hypothetical protein